MMHGGAIISGDGMDLLKLDLAKAEPEALSEGEVHFQASLLSALACAAVSFVARFGFDAPLIPEMMAQAFFAILPINFIALVVGFLGPFAKHLAFLGFVVIYVAALTAASYAFLRYSARLRPPWRTAIDDSENSHLRTAGDSLAIFSAFWLAIWLVTMLVILPLFGGGLFGLHLRDP